MSDTIKIGRHKGKKYSEVPAAYLLRVGALTIANRPGYPKAVPDVAAYVEKNRAALEARKKAENGEGEY